ncbi:uncharacterized protein BDR25DRAFT_360732 [Lindgomyces ingoldianus]|uniref:Uncharacterized protein n=1 Tax=Lindgomyces ingoldianus TaxID=673940 RepID=A0ACB6QEJ6_9PLEO|nr:uncharacterized protein BDR25DRAFT_360732 [Lindgomyces ingoldianus]KAF2465378.1 hypothetical protein BDR25DRAFT_360732 [Lindgomyces ingoldianus]
MLLTSTGLSKWLKSPERTTIHTPDLSYFPWAVVEMKRNTEVSEAFIGRCYFQATHPAATALAFETQLLKKSFGYPFPEVPPVIAFTCIGLRVKVWLAYQTTAGIFVPQLRSVANIAAFCVILLNMHLWASRILKPKIQAWIFQAFRKLPLSTLGTQNTPISLSSRSQTYDPSSSNFIYQAFDWATVLIACQPLRKTTLSIFLKEVFRQARKHLNLLNTLLPPHQLGRIHKSLSSTMESAYLYRHEGAPWRPSCGSAYIDTMARALESGEKEDSVGDSSCEFESDEQDGGRLQDSEDDLDSSETDSESGEKLEDSEFESGDESEDESDKNSEFEEDRKITGQHLHVSEEDIAGMLIFKELFPVSLGWTVHNDFEDNDMLNNLLTHLNNFLKPNLKINPGVFHDRNAYSRISKGLESIENGENPNQDTFGYMCVEILSPGFWKLTAEEIKRMEDDAFIKFNTEDQNSDLLR